MSYTPMTTGDIPSLLVPGLICVKMDQEIMPQQWTNIWEHYKSDKAVEFATEMEVTPVATFKPEGTPIQFASMSQLFSMNAVIQSIGLGTGFSWESISDNLYKEYFPKASKSLTQSSDEFKNINAMVAFNNAFSNTAPIYDGQPLGSLSHPTTVGTIANTFNSPVGLNENAVEQALAGVHSFVNSVNIKMNIDGSYLLVPINLEWQAKRITDSKFRTQTANNDISVIERGGYLPKGSHVNKYLTNQNNWFLFTSYEDGFRFLDRESLEIDAFSDFQTNTLQIRMLERYAFMILSWRGVFCVTGA
jgi:hypothetical protein